MCQCEHRQHSGGLLNQPLGVCVCAPYTSWFTRSLCGPKENSSLRAVQIPGHLNMGADILSRQGLRPGEWMLHPEVVKQIWRVLGQAQVDLFATRQLSHCPLCLSLTPPAPLGLHAMLQTWLSMGDSCQEGSPLTGRGT